MEISIERANINDAAELIDVQNRGFYEDYQKYGHCPSYNEPVGRILELIKNDVVYKIVLDGRIIGDVIIRIKEHQNYYLRVIAVIPEYWNQGIGTKVMKYIEEDNRDAKKWSLVTPHKSFRNHHFHEKMGYKKVGEIIYSEKLTLWEYEKAK